MLSVVIPVFNEEENLPQLYERLVGTSPDWGMEWELILVDDGSRDGSLGLMLAMAGQDAHVRIVKLSRNFGHQAAVSAGMAAAKGRAVVIMDADLQDPPEELPRFLAKWREGYHVVYAVRTKRKESWRKRLAYKVFYRVLQRISNIPIPLDSGDFCVMDRKVVDVLLREMPENIRFVRGLRAYAGFRQVGVPYERHGRAAGQVKYTYRKMIQLALDGIFDFSVFPLRIATYFGLFISIPSFLMGTFFVFHRLLDFKVLGYSPKDTPGLATLAVGMFFLGGVMLIILGILGEYIGRIYVEVKRRPFYIVEEVIETKRDQRV